MHETLFASLGVGILIPVIIVVVLLMVKMVFPGKTTGMFMVWFFCWPIFVIRIWPEVTSDTAILLSFVLGTIVDIAWISLVAYLGFRALRSERMGIAGLLGHGTHAI